MFNIFILTKNFWLSKIYKVNISNNMSIEKYEGKLSFLMTLYYIEWKCVKISAHDRDSYPIYDQKKYFEVL